MDLFDDIGAAQPAPEHLGGEQDANASAYEANDNVASTDGHAPEEEHAAASYVIKCRGLPWQVLYEDVESFFADCDLVAGSLLLTWNQRGDGFVLVSTDKGFRRALSKNRQSMGSRYIEVERSDMAEYSRVRDGELN